VAFRIYYTPFDATFCLRVNNGYATVDTIFKVRMKCGGNADYTINVPTSLDTSAERYKE
jgi:hypothetical protein